ncbi:MAG: hypothetical protein ABI624_10045, partial [Casimicrobiaceae bacterium]
AIAALLSSDGDLRAGALQAIMGGTKRGRKAKAAPLMPYSADEAKLAHALVTEMKITPRRAQAVADVARKERVSEKTVEAAYTAVAKTGTLKP